MEHNLPRKLCIDDCPRLRLLDEMTAKARDRGQQLEAEAKQIVNPYPPELIPETQQQLIYRIARKQVSEFLADAATSWDEIYVSCVNEPEEIAPEMFICTSDAPPTSAESGTF